MPLHIFFTTDIHGNYFSYDFRYRREGDGSLQRVCAFVAEQRRRYGEENVLLLDGGDMIQGGPEAYFFNHIDNDEAHRVGEMCRFVGYDAGAVGNHDIESGAAAMRRFQQSSGYPLLAANITDSRGAHPFAPYTVIRRGGMKIAVVGFTTPATKRWLPDELCKDYTFHDILESASGWAERIRKTEQPDLLIALLHSGWKGGLHDASWCENVTQELAEHTGGYDLVLFGHDHFSRVETVENNEGNLVACVNAGCYGYEVGEAVVKSDAYGHLTIEGRLHDIRRYENDIMGAFRLRFKEPFRRVLYYTSTRLGRLCTRLDISRAYYGPSSYMSLIHTLQLSVSHADISICSPYFMDSVIEPGTFFVADLYTIYWFEDRLYTIRMTGREIKNLLERSYWLWTNTVSSPDEQLLKTDFDPATGKQVFKNLYFNFDNAAGLDYEVDVAKPFGEKIRIKKMSNGAEFLLDKEYTVATIGHRANGGGQMLTLGAGIPEEELPLRVVSYTPYDIRHYLRLFIEQKQTVDVPLIDNWRFLLRGSLFFKWS